mmetsp:Transcript_27962/g.58126  ORF Transcript_27962/g.58126 Transcript_27962/m.58126 type:complete len:274 (+) Transcript_27962:144-965(+)
MNKNSYSLIGIGCFSLGIIAHFQSSVPPINDAEFFIQQETVYYHPANKTDSKFRFATEKTYVEDVCNTNKRRQPQEFKLKDWKTKTGDGLEDEDRVMLGSFYGSANSLFEWGLGESSYLAGHLNVPRYAGVDSDAEWVSSAREKCPKHFRFSFADIGKTREFGNPTENLDKNVYNYIIAPLKSEMCPFDVYMVDGRYRVGCALMALLHASEYNHNATILLHDYVDERPEYKVLEEVCEIVKFSGKRLVAFKRKPHVTDQMIYDLFESKKERIG